MAGVGFELKRLFRARTATGHLKAYSYSAIVTTGPFALLTSMVLRSILVPSSIPSCFPSCSRAASRSS